MATSDSKDKKIGEVPHLENVTGVEKIPVSAAGGLPRYVEVKQIREHADEAEVAERLKTPVKLWGQEFDGSKDVSGDLKLNYYECIEFNGPDYEVTSLDYDTLDTLTSNISTLESKLKGVTKAADDSNVVKGFAIQVDREAIKAFPYEGMFSITRGDGIILESDGDNLVIAANRDFLATKADLNSYVKSFNVIGEGVPIIPNKGEISLEGSTGIEIESDSDNIQFRVDTNVIATRDFVTDITDTLAANQSEDLANITELQGKLNGIGNVQDFVNSSISTATAEFKGTYNSLSELQAQEADANDYGFVVSTDSEGNTVYNRYKYVEGEGWLFEYALNNSSFTAPQWEAIQSGITSGHVAKLDLLKGLYITNVSNSGGSINITQKSYYDGVESSKSIDFKTINGKSLFGQGDLKISGDVTKNEFDVLETTVETLNQGLGDKEDRVPIEIVSGETLAAKAGRYYRFDEAVNTLAITLPNVEDTTRVKVLELFFTTGNSPQITINGNGAGVKYFSGFAIEPNTTYELNIMFNGNEWIVAYGTVE